MSRTDRNIIEARIKMHFFSHADQYPNVEDEIQQLLSGLADFGEHFELISVVHPTDAEIIPESESTPEPVQVGTHRVDPYLILAEKAGVPVQKIKEALSSGKFRFRID